ncbi:hypothetical protein DC366_03575 [Pelagivirga sediminicola]|uniref:Uncharacterized protein n=1 Tax=Pelagivirga sediminicola TaxID=2170575 RepID=A0A2T7GC54_9RHOB|nr:hypothetical protein DC366_03575 [Pelagivirga sediminicola]
MRGIGCSARALVTGHAYTMASLDDARPTALERSLYNALRAADARTCCAGWPNGQWPQIDRRSARKPQSDKTKTSASLSGSFWRDKLHEHA